ncbi:unnamed protein product [Aureobasidium uvarum]|uniref:Uncharacterized protein n=1 Tax=Aureobasidium uvarum TaxID=2773716 RepID=A0A9N8KT05_9PEZI|nr:unnamed protein product [Aureobasidium uvarum]
MPRGSEYSDEKRAAALIMFLIHNASHSDVEAKTGVSKTAIRQLSSRAHKAGIDRTSIEELIVFARTKPRKGRPRRDATKAVKPSPSEGHQGDETTQSLQSNTVAANAEPSERPAATTAMATSRTASGEDLFRVIKSWEQCKNQAIDASYAGVAKEQT